MNLDRQWSPEKPCIIGYGMKYDDRRRGIRWANLTTGYLKPVPLEISMQGGSGHFLYIGSPEAGKTQGGAFVHARHAIHAGHSLIVRSPHSLFTKALIAEAIRAGKHPRDVAIVDPCYKPEIFGVPIINFLHARPNQPPDEVAEEVVSGFQSKFEERLMERGSDVLRNLSARRRP
jgi:hypothetical protein